MAMDEEEKEGKIRIAGLAVATPPVSQPRCYGTAPKVSNSSRHRAPIFPRIAMQYVTSTGTANYTTNFRQDFPIW